MDICGDSLNQDFQTTNTFVKLVFVLFGTSKAN